MPGKLRSPVAHQLPGARRPRVWRPDFRRPWLRWLHVEGDARPLLPPRLRSRPVGGFPWRRRNYLFLFLITLVVDY